MDIELSEYLDIFVEETRERLQDFSHDLIELENIKGEKSQSNRIELLNNLFRIAHSLKGMSGSMDFNNMEKLCHTMENLLDDLRNEKIEITPDIIDILLACFTKLEALTDSVENQKSDDLDISVILNILDNLKSKNQITIGIKDDEEIKEEQDAISATKFVSYGENRQSIKM